MRTNYYARRSTRVRSRSSKREFGRADFVQGDRAIRLSRGLASALLHATSLSSREINDAAEWMELAINCAAN
jgi:hypothetical protein